MGNYADLGISGLLDIQPSTELEVALQNALRTFIKPKRLKFDPLLIVLPIGVCPDIWADWVGYRKEKRKPVGERAAKEQLTLLALYTKPEQRAMVDNSIRNEYQGLFPPKGGAREIGQRTVKQTFADRTRDQAASVINGAMGSSSVVAYGRSVRR